MGILDAPYATKRGVREQRPPGNAGIRIFGGRMGTYDNTTPTTFQMTCELQQHFDAIQVIFGTTGASYSDNTVLVKAASLPASSDLNGNSATWTQVTKGGLSRIAFAISPASNRINYTLSDVIPVSSVARSDSGTKPILVVRAYMSANAALPVVGNGTDSFTNWATRSDGYLWCMRAQSGDNVTTPTTWTSTTNISQCPIVGVRYFARGKVINIMTVGDSISEGRGTYLGEGFGGLIADRLTTSSVAVQYSNCGWSTQTSAVYTNRALDILQSDVKPDVMIFPSCSPNNEDPLTAAGFVTAAGQRNTMLAECTRWGVVPVMWTMLPCDPGVHNWGSSDSFRTADNTTVMTLANRGILVADTATPMNGTTSNGQIDFSPTYTTDGVHPNDTGNISMADQLEPLVARAAGLTL